MPRLRTASPLALFAALVVSPWLVDCVGDDAGSPSPDGGGSADGAGNSDGGGGTEASSTDGGAEAGNGVTGKVVDATGSPVANATVRLGAGAPITTDANGAFSFPDAPAQYDLDVVESNKTIRSFRGIRTRTPLVHTRGTQFTAPVTINYTGAPDAGQNTRIVGFIADESSSSGTTQGSSFVASWLGSNSASGALVLLPIAVDLSNKTTALLGQPSIATVALTANAAHSQNLAYASSAQASITGNVLLQGTVSFASATLHDPQLPPIGLSYNLPLPVGGSLSAPTASYAGATYDVLVVASQSNPKEQIASVVTGLAPNATGVSWSNIATPVHASSPADGATAVDATTSFSWTTAPGTFQLRVLCQAASFEAYVYTTGTSAKLPDLAGLGQTLPATAACAWYVTSYPTHADVDDFVGDKAKRANILASSYSAVTNVTFTSK